MNVRQRLTRLEKAAHKLRRWWFCPACGELNPDRYYCGWNGWHDISMEFEQFRRLKWPMYKDRPLGCCLRQWLHTNFPAMETHIQPDNSYSGPPVDPEMARMLDEAARRHVAGTRCWLCGQIPARVTPIDNEFFGSVFGPRDVWPPSVSMYADHIAELISKTSH